MQLPAASTSSKERRIRASALLFLLLLTATSAVADIRVFIADDPRGHIDLNTNDGQTIEIPHGAFFYGSWSRHVGYRGCFSGRCGATQGGQHEVSIREFVVAPNNALTNCEKRGHDSFTAFYQCPEGLLPTPTCTIDPDISMDGDYYSSASCDLIGNDALSLLYSVGIAARLETLLQQQEAVARYNEGFRSNTSQGMPYTINNHTLATYLRTTCCADEPGENDQPTLQYQQPQPRQATPQQPQQPLTPHNETMGIGFWLAILIVGTLLAAGLWQMYIHSINAKANERLRRATEADRIEQDRARQRREHEDRESARKAEIERERQNKTLLDQQARAAALVNAERNRPVPPMTRSLHDELTKLNDAIVESRAHHQREKHKVLQSNYDPLVERAAINALDKRQQEELKRLDSEIKVLLSNDTHSRAEMEHAQFIQLSQQHEHRISVLTNALIESYMPIHAFKSLSPDVQNCLLDSWKRGDVLLLPKLQ